MTRDLVVNCAYSYKGYYSNPNEFTKWFWNNDLKHAWCGAFIEYVIKHDLKCNWLDDCDNFGYVPSIVQWAKKKGYWRDNYKEAKKGDLVVYDFTPETKGGMEHIGIVDSLDDSTLTSVDGNTTDGIHEKDCVAKRTRKKEYVTGIIKLPYDNNDFNIGDYVYAKEDIKLYTTIEYKESKYTLKKGEKAYVRYKQNNNIALANPDTKEYFASAWTNELDKLTNDIDYKELYEKELLINKDLKLQIDYLQNKINKAIDDLNS